MNTDSVWKELLIDITAGGSEVRPRGIPVKELIGSSYRVDMNKPIISLASRKVNHAFMFAEAAWICGGSNWLADLTPYMKRYADFSDDGVFLNGAYGVKVAEQVAYAADTLSKDRDSRQAIINIWRERPASSKDIPCTINMQFFIRDHKLHMVTNMRSQDVVLGFTYDVFTFSAVAALVRSLLILRGINVELGFLHVHVGSLHLYETHFDKVDEWLHDVMPDAQHRDVQDDWTILLAEATSPRFFVHTLKMLADDYS
jgi:thymidylate synthase